jgi:hypothetical protein
MSGQLRFESARAYQTDIIVENTRFGRISSMPWPVRNGTRRCRGGLGYVSPSGPRLVMMIQKLTSAMTIHSIAKSRTGVPGTCPAALW